jgi:glycosyltransferase 2 family protein
MGIQITRKRIRRGLQVFTLLSLSSLVVIFVLTRSHITTEALKNINPLMLLLALPLIGVDWLGGGYRIYIFSRVLHPSIRFKTCVKANLANYFMAAVTPSQTGGGPAQIYVLYAGGMRAVEATSASLMTFFSTTFFLIMAAAAMFVFKASVPLQGRMLHHLFNVGVFFFLIVSVLVVVALVFPGFYREAARWLFVALSHIRKKDYFRAGSWVNRVIHGIDMCHQQLIFFLKKQWHVLLFGIAIICALFFSKFVVAYLIAKSLGAQASLIEVMLLQTVIVLINYLFPSPGSSGAAELSSAALMAAVVSKAMISFYVVLWRLLTMYLAVAVGGVIVLRELGKRERIEIANGAEKGAAQERIASVVK